MEYKIAIPTYKRVDTIQKKTLAMLESYGIPPDQIYIFVSDPEEVGLYREAIGIKYKNIIPGEIGMKNNRNAITKHFRIGEKIVNIDDDIRSIVEMVDKKTLRPVKDLDAFFRWAFELSEKHKCKLWGIYYPSNPYFMKHKITLDLRYLPGGLFGVEITHDPEMLADLDDKEDFERTIKYYQRDGRVMRFNYISMITTCYTEPGGMAEERTNARNTESCKYLVKKYPHLTQFRNSKKTGFDMDIRLKDNTLKR